VRRPREEGMGNTATALCSPTARSGPT
jgi:hypothetical protein